MISHIEPVVWANGRIRLLDQTKLPREVSWVEIDNWRDAATAIKNMIVRGAPAIGCTAALGLALAACSTIAPGRDAFIDKLQVAADGLCDARPTAVNLSWAVNRLMELARALPEVTEIKQLLVTEAIKMLEEDVHINRTLGQYGAELLPETCSIITHCNAGALATAGYGTALGVIRAAVESGKQVTVFADETRPRLQGMKLTAWELMESGIPVTVITDNMSAALMRSSSISCVVVGADRIAANGDTANKIGTYGLAVIAKHHNIPFYVAAPVSTFDFSLATGADIPIEERDSMEVTHIDGVAIGPANLRAWNPAFDVTPADLIAAIITERGVIKPPFTTSITNLQNRN